VLGDTPEGKGQMALFANINPLDIQRLVIRIGS